MSKLPTEIRLQSSGGTPGSWRGSPRSRVNEALKLTPESALLQPLQSLPLPRRSVVSETSRRIFRSKGLVADSR